jgi:hypothetical protein
LCPSGDYQIFRAAFCSALLQQVAPGVISVRVAPVFALAADHRGRTVCSRVLRRDQPIECIVGEGLIAVLVFVIRDAENVPIGRPRSAVPDVEVTADGEHNLAGAGISSRWWRHAPALHFLNPVFPTDHVHANITFHMEVTKENRWKCKYDFWI